MEVDRILYIFGSFTRKKQDKRKSLEQLSLSAGNSPLHANGSRRPVSQNLNVAPRTSAYIDGRKSKVKEWDCGICKKELVEPRLLGCLHNFCTRCLQGLHQEGEAEVWNEVDGGSIQLDPGGSRSGSGAGSAGSGYESDLRHSGSEGTWEQKQQQHKYGILTRKVSGKSVQFLLCPTCGYETQLPLGGISALPLNYVLLRKMAAAQDSEGVNVLCDLCSSDNKAETRCSQCLVSICTSCGEAHGRQKATARHSLHPLEPAPVKYCSQHPKAELSVYCATCQQMGSEHIMYYVIQFLEPPYNNVDKYVCVPSSWTKQDKNTYPTISVAYPDEHLPSIREDVRKNRGRRRDWSFYRAVAIYVSDSFSYAENFIKKNNNTEPKDNNQCSETKPAQSDEKDSVPKRKIQCSNHNVSMDPVVNKSQTKDPILRNNESSPIRLCPKRPTPLISKDIPFKKRQKTTETSKSVNEPSADPIEKQLESMHGDCSNEEHRDETIFGTYYTVENNITKKVYPKSRTESTVNGTESSSDSASLSCHPFEHTNKEKSPTDKVNFSNEKPQDKDVEKGKDLNEIKVKESKIAENSTKSANMPASDMQNRFKSSSAKIKIIDNKTYHSSNTENVMQNYPEVADLPSQVPNSSYNNPSLTVNIPILYQEQHQRGTSVGRSVHTFNNVQQICTDVTRITPSALHHLQHLLSYCSHLPDHTHSKQSLTFNGNNPHQEPRTQEIISGPTGVNPIDQRARCSCNCSNEILDSQVIQNQSYKEQRSQATPIEKSPETNPTAKSIGSKNNTENEPSTLQNLPNKNQHIEHSTQEQLPSVVKPTVVQETPEKITVEKNSVVKDIEGNTKPKSNIDKQSTVKQNARVSSHDLPAVKLITEQALLKGFRNIVEQMCLTIVDEQDDGECNTSNEFNEAIYEILKAVDGYFGKTTNNTFASASKDGSVKAEMKKNKKDTSNYNADDDDKDDDGDDDSDDGCNETLKKKGGSKRRFVLPPEYDSKDSRWTLKYQRAVPEIIELMPHSNIFIDSVKLANCKRSAKDYKSFGRMLLTEIFTQNALSVCSLTGARANSFSVDKSDVRPGLNENARSVLLTYVEEYGSSKGWGLFDSHSVINSIRSKIQEMRPKKYDAKA